MRVPEKGRRLRAIFLSDVHLGMRASKSARLVDFLRHHDAEAVYLVGDIVDGWRLRARWHWPREHNDVLDELLNAARNGTRIVYIPGNHDAFLRDYCGMHFCGIEVADSIIHVAADGRRYLVIHGDDFDQVVKVVHRMAPVGHRANAILLAISGALAALRTKLGLSYWSFSQWAKHRVKKAVNYIDAYEKALADLAQRHEADGIICGHVHHATIHENFGVRYINCGDWIESCTAVAERHDGRFEILTWTGEEKRAPVLGLPQPQAV